MPDAPETLKTRERLLRAEVEWLRSRMKEPEATLDAIRSGEVDAFVVLENEEERVYTLRSPEPPFRLMVEEMKEGAATLDAGGTILYANRRLADQLAIPSSAVRGASLLEFLPPDQSARVQGLLEGTSGGHAEVVMRRRDGSTFPASIAVNAFREGEVAAFCAVITDLTEQKRHAEVAAAEAAWRAADRRKDEFLAILAHELRNPLAAIGHAIQILQQLGPPEPTLVRARDVIDRQVGHVARIVDDLLDVSRIVSGKIQIFRDHVDLSALVERTVEMEKAKFTARGRNLSVSLTPDPVWVDADPTRLQQVISNLLDNAQKFTAESGHVFVSLRKDGGQAIVSVRDDGVGIPPELIGHVFDLFAQANRSRGQNPSGLGLGLTLVRRLIELHGGSVSVRSDGKGRGSEFLVSLPTVESAKESVPAPAHAPRTPAVSERRRVLVVEDHVDSAEGLAALLRLEDHEVRIVADGLQALSSCRDYRPDLILLDLGLPGMDGFETGRQLRALLGDDVVIVALTGYGQEDDRRRSIEAGIDHHVLKPLRIGALDRFLSRPR